MHSCGELLLVDNSHAGRACCWDSASIMYLSAHDRYFIVKHGWEAKILLAGLDHTQLKKLSDETDIPLKIEREKHYRVSLDFPHQCAALC